MSAMPLCIAVTASLALASCGGPSAEEQAHVNRTVARAEFDIADYCAYGGAGGARAVRDLTRLYRQDPDMKVKRRHSGASTVRDVVKDAAGELERCNRGYARRLDRVLR